MNFIRSSLPTQFCTLIRNKCYHSTLLSPASYVMQLALRQAQSAYKNNELPIGCVLFDPEKRAIISCGQSRMNTLKDPLAQAEIECLKAAIKIFQYEENVNKINKNNKKNEYNFKNLVLYTTLTPCAR